jgi:hypothetical protein
MYSLHNNSVHLPECEICKWCDGKFVWGTTAAAIRRGVRGPSLTFVEEKRQPVSLILLAPSCIFIKECILIFGLGLQYINII